jgi:hypothetical protein
MEPADGDAGNLSLLRELVTGDDIADDIEDPEDDYDAADDGGDQPPVDLPGRLTLRWLFFLC